MPIKFLVAHHPPETIAPHDLSLLKRTPLWLYSWPKPEPRPKIRSREAKSQPAVPQASVTHRSHFGRLDLNQALAFQPGTLAPEFRTHKKEYVGTRKEKDISPPNTHFLSF
jgi:hypothetical protein